ncbi:MAG TPA: hypothetical protein VFN61_08875 [Acidimicrobiales bacterium]|nr:hypothetical protein [Acidimicrobiales bacterium]
MISEQDVALMTEACRDLPEPVGNYLVDDYLTNLVATVIDFQAQTTAVERALSHFASHVRPELDNLADLVRLMDRWPADRVGNTALARHLWGYSMWTRAEMLRNLVTYFSAIGVTDQGSLRNWAERATFERDFKGRVRGLGPAVFQWLVMRQGIDTVKPDVHVHRFAAKALGRQLSDADVVEVTVAAANRVGRPAHRVDWAIWEAGRGGAVGTTPGHYPEEPQGQSPLAAPPEPTQGFDGKLVSFLDNDAGYLAWLTAHPDGYVVNTERRPNARYLVLHRATCYTMKPRDVNDNRTWTAAYLKACGISAHDLVGWAQAHAAARPTACRTCRPEP